MAFNPYEQGYQPIAPATSWQAAAAAAAANKYSDTSKYSYNPYAGVRVVDGVIQTGYAKKPVADAPVASAPKKSKETVDSDPEQKVKDRRDWEDYKTPEMDMAHQMGTYTSKDSPLMIAAETAAKRQQNSLGLLNTQGTVSAVQNNMWNAALPLASEDVSRATNVALTQMGDDLQRDMLEANITSNEAMTFAKIWGDMVNTQLASMGAVMSNPDTTWTQTMQDNFEDSIGASRDFVGSLFNIQLS